MIGRMLGDGGRQSCRQDRVDLDGDHVPGGVEQAESE
jgi:hypothetical protein